jgi:hypothetical protein
VLWLVLWQVGNVKLEIDTSNLASLQKQERELDIALRTVRSAIRAIRENPEGQPNLIEVERIASAEDNLADKIVHDVFQLLPENFTTSEIVDQAFLRQPGLSRGAVRNAISRLEKSGRISIVEIGKGRRPTLYIKMRHHAELVDNNLPRT